MIHHFFGSKEKVFLAAARIPIDPDTVLAILLAGPREQFPERLVTAFGAAWRDERTGPALQSVLRAAVAMLLGRAVAAVLLGIEPLASASDEELAVYYVPALRAALSL